MPKSHASTLAQPVLPERNTRENHALESAPRTQSTLNTASDEPHVITLSIPALSDYVRVVRLAVTGVASRMKFAYDEVEDIKLAVSEACNNAILHAVPPSNKPQALPLVTVELIPHADCLEVCVSDEGHVPEPGLPAPQVRHENSLLPENGLGLILIQTLMDEVSHHTSPVDRTVVRMIKRVRH